MTSTRAADRSRIEEIDADRGHPFEALDSRIAEREKTSTKAPQLLQLPGLDLTERAGIRDLPPRPYGVSYPSTQKGALLADSPHAYLLRVERNIASHARTMARHLTQGF